MHMRTHEFFTFNISALFSFSFEIYQKKCIKNNKSYQYINICAG